MGTSIVIGIGIVIGILLTLVFEGVMLLLITDADDKSKGWYK